MLIPRIIPVLLLKNNGLVKTTCFKRPVYIGDPINAVKIFNEKEVDELIILDILATCEKRDPDYKSIEKISSEAFMPVGYGGGINNINQIECLFKSGIEKIIINSAIYSNPKLIAEAAKIFGDQSIVISIDVRKNLFGNYSVYSNCGRKKVRASLEEIVKFCIENGAGEIFLNSIDRDGTMKGYDINLIKKVSNISSVPLIACGGAGKLDHFELAFNAGASAVAAGSMFVFYGVHKAVLINYPSNWVYSINFKRNYYV